LKSFQLCITAVGKGLAHKTPLLIPLVFNGLDLIDYCVLIIDYLKHQLRTQLHLIPALAADINYLPAFKHKILAAYAYQFHVYAWHFFKA
jgi:hypothetical protein